MTKEDLKDKLYELSDMVEYKNIEFLNILDEFFSQNVVISRGENRHPYADALHEWIEDTTSVLQKDLNSTLSNGMYPSEWVDLMHIQTINTLRIKPSEPIYEWQWLVKEFDDTLWYVVGMGKYYTEKEIGNWCGKKCIEETKRVRL